MRKRERKREREREREREKERECEKEREREREREKNKWARCKKRPGQGVSRISVLPPFSNNLSAVGKDMPTLAFARAGVEIPLKSPAIPKIHDALAVATAVRVLANVALPLLPLLNVRLPPTP